MSRKTIHDWVNNNCGKCIVVKFLPKGFFVAVFTEESERNHISKKENWYLGNNPLYIQPWTPNFDPTPLAVYEKPVWVRLFNLSIEYWSDSSLEKIGRTLGTLLEIDEEIIENDLYTYARTIQENSPKDMVQNDHGIVDGLVDSCSETSEPFEEIEDMDTLDPRCIS
ncbi:hypothetical protein SUGI_0789000 [Cryptomeria japonica]|nr:hypothetical protein SUGI_0789000 [Cryptomeria japonica]